MKKYLLEYDRWCCNATADADLIKELKTMEKDSARIEDAFYCDLEFGTGGIRGVIGAGPNRMNVYTVAKASQGLANYVIKKYTKDKGIIAVSYDSRNKSDLFSKVASGVFVANGLKVNIYPQLMPTPCLSYAVRALGCAAGIMITASHNHSSYNGYKVYGPDGCQITTEAAAGILAEMEKIDVFNDVKTRDFDEGLQDGLISWIKPDVYAAYIEEVKKQSVLYGEEVDRNVSVVYSPLNGTGLDPVTRTLRETGFCKISIVKEQEQPDGSFPTCPYPNPERKEAMNLGIEYATRMEADLLLATDPDCDRCGVAVRNFVGQYTLLSGNEVGLLLLDFICSQRLKHIKMPKDASLIKTIVTTDLAECIAEHYGVKTINVLTGFKFIGEQIGLLEKKDKIDSYIFGFEESYGYLSGSYVRDKDAVNAAFMICEMFAYYKTHNISLLERLDQLYLKYGFCLNRQYSFEFDGSVGLLKIQNIMSGLRMGFQQIGAKRVIETLDYLNGLDGLPKSNVIKFLLEGNCSFVVRPSGTEPKLKVYISVSANDRQEAEKIEKQLLDALKVIFL